MVSNLFLLFGLEFDNSRAGDDAAAAKKKTNAKELKYLDEKQAQNICKLNRKL